MAIFATIMFIFFSWLTATSWKEFYYARETMSLKAVTKKFFWAIFLTSTTIMVDCIVLMTLYEYRTRR